jgi:predicted nucleic acid-binding OB-fold protein
MKITTEDGQELELVSLKPTDNYALKVGEEVYGLKPVVPMEPVKKTEKRGYQLDFSEDSEKSNFEGVIKYLNLTPTTAHKLSEAISALVEFVTIEDDGNISVFGKKNVAYGRFEDLIRQARQSFQESQ